VALLLPLRWIPPPASAFMLRHGLEHGGYDFRWTPLERISSCLPAAVIAAEDQKFPRHFGFDLESIRDAVAARERRLRGASTISQQTVKNLYLWPGRSFLRKGIEAWLTLYLELLWPKARIAEVYVNIAEFGPGIYGARAASLHFFGKEPAALGEEEAALLAAVLPSPKRLSPAPATPYVLERARWIRGQMRNAAGCRLALGAPSGVVRLATALRGWIRSFWSRIPESG
jgi:monofunctional biosynthetic peptidoglycan transglycosylase